MRRLLFFLLIVLAFVPANMPLHYAVAAEEAEAPSDAKKSEGDEGKKEEGGDKSKKDGSKDTSGGRFAGDPVYVHLAPMILPIISDSGVEQLVTFQIDIEVKDFDVADHIHSIMPRVVDSLMRALYGGLGQGSLRKGKLVDVTKIKAKATVALDEVIGADGIRDVLIQGVAQRML